MFKKRFFVIRVKAPSDVLEKMKKILFDSGSTSVAIDYNIDYNNLCLKLIVQTRSKLMVKLLCKLLEFWAKALSKN